MCVNILFKLNSVFLLVFAVFLTLTRNRMIVYFEAKQPTRVADKNIFSSDLPSCWITGTEKQSVFWRTKQNSTQIIPWVSFIVHYEFSAQHTVWMQCEIHVQYSTVVFRVFTSKWKQHACSTILKCVAARVWYYFRDSPAPCFLITNIGRSLTLAGRLFRKPWMSWGTDWVRVPCIRVDPVFTVNRHYRERSCNQQFLDFTEAL